MKYLFLAATLLTLLAACTESKKRPTFDSIAGIRFTEVRREYDTGSSFSEQGFQQNPEWVLYFLPHDSVKIYSPKRRRFIYYPIYYDHDSVFNFAREWFRMKMISKDSMVLQLLQVNSKREISRELSNVYMRFYSQHYLESILHADPEKLKMPNRFDTLYIRQKTARAARNPQNPDSTFAGRIPVTLKSKLSTIQVQKAPPLKDILSDPKASDEYLYPVYDVTIRKAYKDFYYSFSALVSEKGQIHVITSLQLAEDMEGRRKVLQSIADIYLSRYLTITPGSTLGIKHGSKVVFNVKGEKR